MKFTATCIEHHTTHLIANLLFADPEADPDEPAVLAFSRNIEAPDTAYYFEINDQSYGQYGGLEAVQLARNQLVIRLAPDVVEEFGVEEFAEVQVDFETDDDTYQAVEDMLKVIFANEDILTVA